MRHSPGEKRCLATARLAIPIQDNRLLTLTLL